MTPKREFLSVFLLHNALVGFCCDKLTSEKWSLLQSGVCQTVTVHTRSANPITSFHPKLNFAVKQSLEILVCPSLSWLYFVSYDLFGLTDRKSALIWWVSLAVMSGKTLLSCCHHRSWCISNMEQTCFSYFCCKCIWYIHEVRSYWKCTGWWSCHCFLLFWLDAQCTACPSQQLLEFRNFLI